MLEGLNAQTETGELHINSSKLREEHIGIWKNGGVFLLKNKNKDTHYKYSVLFSGTTGIFSRSIQEIE